MDMIKGDEFRTKIDTGLQAGPADVDEACLEFRMGG